MTQRGQVIVVAAVLLLASCTPEVSQVFIRITADPGVVAAGVGVLRIRVDAGDSSVDLVEGQEYHTLDGSLGFPREIALAPKDDDPTRWYRILVFAHHGSFIDGWNEESFVQAGIVGTYLRGQGGWAEIHLDASCIDRPCEENQSCANMMCIPAPEVVLQPRDGVVSDASMCTESCGSPSCPCDGGVDMQLAQDAGDMNAGDATLVDSALVDSGTDASDANAIDMMDALDMTDAGDIGDMNNTADMNDTADMADMNNMVDIDMNNMAVDMSRFRDLDFEKDISIVDRDMLLTVDSSIEP